MAQAAVDAEEAKAAARARRRAEREDAARAAGRKLAGARPAPPHQEHRGLRKARARLAQAQARAAAGDDAEPRNDGERPKRPSPPRANVTDPDSRLMHSPHGWVQGYNAQAAVSEDGIVLAAEVTQDHNDVHQCQPMLAATQANTTRAALDAPLGVVLFDAGYLSEDNLTAEGPDRLIATGKTHRLRQQPPTAGPPPPNATPTEAMAHRLRTDEGRTLYAKRQHTVEPVFGEAKHLRGFRRFARRGLPAVNAEWKLQMTVHNLLKAFRHQPAPTPA